MKNVIAYKGFPYWIYNPDARNGITCRLSVRQTDGTYKETVVNNIIKNDPWSGNIETDHVLYYQSFKEGV